MVRFELPHDPGLLRVGVGDGDRLHPAAVVVEHVDNAPVGHLGRRQFGHLGQRGAVVERRPEDLTGLGQEGEPTLGRLLPLEQARSVEGLGAVLSQREGEGLLVVTELVRLVEAEAEAAEHPPVHHEGDGGHRPRAGRDHGGRVAVGHVLERADPHRLAGADRFGQRVFGHELDAV